MIYLHLPLVKVIYLVYVFDKGEATDLTADEKRELRAIAEAIKKEYRK